MKRWYGTVAAVFLAVLSASVAAAACREDQVALRNSEGSVLARFQVDVADDPQERSRGLMFVESMPSSQGMLFIYPTPVRATFWMKNTLIPLDMLFIDPEGRVRNVHHQAVPGDLSTIDGGDGILSVLEINGGLARAMGLTEGVEVQHPAFGRNAAWPCTE